MDVIGTVQEPEYKTLLHVDRSRMDEMLDTQPMRYMWAVEQSAAADLEVRRLQQTLDVVSADIYNRLKSTPVGGKAPSDKAVEVNLKADSDYIAAMETLSRAKSDAKIMAGVVDAFNQRKTMLAKSVEMMISGLKSDPEKLVSKKALESGASDAMKDSFERRS